MFVVTLKTYNSYHITCNNVHFMHRFCCSSVKFCFPFFLFRCIAALLGAHVLLTDLPDRLKLLKKNVEENLYGNVRGSATVIQLTWGDHPDPKLINPYPDYGNYPFNVYIINFGVVGCYVLVTCSHFG